MGLRGPLSSSRCRLIPLRRLSHRYLSDDERSVTRPGPARAHQHRRRPNRLRPEDKGQAGACPDRTRAIPCTVPRQLRICPAIGGRSEGSTHHDPEDTRNDLGHARRRQLNTSRWTTNSLDCRGGLRSRERARCVPERKEPGRLRRALPRSPLTSGSRLPGSRSRAGSVQDRS